MNLLQRMMRSGAPATEIAAALDDLSHKQRLDEVLVLSRAQQRSLFYRVRGALDLGLEHFVPDELGDLEEVIHWGRNSLPAFQRFQKRFCRPPQAQQSQPPVLWGYNEQTMKAFTGPGYFCARLGDPEHPVWIDYRGAPPPGGAPGWPRPLDNKQRLSRVIYYGTVDKMRRVSDHVSVGSAFRGQKELGAYFVLVRQP